MNNFGNGGSGTMYRSGGGQGGMNASGVMTAPGSPQAPKLINTYGLSLSFLESLGIYGPLVSKVFVANVSSFIMLKLTIS